MREKHTTQSNFSAADIELMMQQIARGAEGDRVLTADGKDLGAVLLGRKGGLKGGRARAESLSSERRSEIAKAAAQKRWDKKNV